MHYIRILKPPRLLPTHSPLSLSAKVTVTTDLGESFLLSNILVVVELEFEDGTSVGQAKGREFVWRGRDGMRSLEVVVPVPLSKGKRKVGGEMVRMLIRPKEEEFAVDSFHNLLDGHNKDEDSGDKGSVVAVRSMAINTNPGAKGNNGLGVGMAERAFLMGSGSNEQRVRIWEETGESIARHIWYASDLDRDGGLVFSSYLAALSTPDPSASSRTPKLPILEKVLLKRDLTVLELGAGCGIVGITLATFFPHLGQVILTDLPAASSILSQNLSPSLLPLSIRSKLSSQVLDWSSPLPPSIASTNWDLILVADCTYNPDVVPDLVATLGRLTGNGKREVLVALAMKVRHESEIIFFELMHEDGFVVREKGKISLPVLGSEGQEIEMFVFGLGG